MREVNALTLTRMVGTDSPLFAPGRRETGRGIAEVFQWGRDVNVNSDDDAFGASRCRVFRTVVLLPRKLATR